MAKAESPLLTRDEGFVIKALCIIVVMMHNYLHLRGYAAENEFQFYQERVGDMWQYIVHLDPRLPLHMISFIVSYALVGFLFISGYGLVKKYEQSSCGFSRWHFLGQHYAKLLLLSALPMLTALVVFTVLRGYWPLHVKDTLLEFLLLGNLQWDVSIYPFIYWYLGMAMQLYVLYALLLHQRSGHYPVWHQVLLVILVVGCGVWQMCCNPTGKWIYYLRTNLVGYVGPFILGMVTARHFDHLRFKRWQWGIILLASSAVMALSLINYYAWLWGWIPAMVFIVSFVKTFPWLPCRPVVWLGSISATAYVIHPIVREVVLTLTHSHILFWLVVYMIVTIILSAGYAWLLRHIKKIR